MYMYRLFVECLRFAQFSLSLTLFFPLPFNSFGMCMFEMSMGLEPWPDMSNEEVVKHLAAGESMFDTTDVMDAAYTKRQLLCKQMGEDVPEASDTETVFHQLVKGLCQVQPERRPGMHDVYQALKAYHQKMKHEREQVPFLSLCVVLVGCPSIVRENSLFIIFDAS